MMMMSSSLSQILSKSLLIVVLVYVAFANARPNHFDDTNNQVVAAEQEASSNNVVDTGLKPWQLEQMFAQRLPWNYVGGEYGGFERSLRGGNEIKRQSRYRLCYFNPVSCYRK